GDVQQEHPEDDGAYPAARAHGTEHAAKSTSWTATRTSTTAHHSAKLGATTARRHRCTRSHIPWANHAAASGHTATWGGSVVTRTAAAPKTSRPAPCTSIVRRPAVCRCRTMPAPRTAVAVASTTVRG